MLATCSNCGASIRPQSKHCTVCGTVLPATPPLVSIPSVSAPGPTVQFPENSNSGAEIVLADGSTMPLPSKTVIGRDPSQCDIAFPDDERISRVHAQLEEQGGQWTLTDLGSSNGTLVKGVKITSPTHVYPGDQIKVGRTTFTLSLSEQAPGPSPLSIVPSSPPVQPLPQVLPPGNPAITPSFIASAIAQTPAGGWRIWKTRPAAEGYVRHISERYMVKKNDLIKRGIAAAALGLFISPALSFLPFIHGNDIPARDMRIEDYHSGRMVDVMIVGEMVGSINLGDAVAVWGQVQGNVLLLQAAYNYATDAQIQVKKK